MKSRLQKNYKQNVIGGSILFIALVLLVGFLMFILSTH